MDKKKTTALGVAIVYSATFLSTGVFAKLNVDNPVIENGLISANGQTDSKNPVTFEIYTKGKPQEKSNMAAFGEGEADESGRFEIKASLDKSGEFTLTVHDGIEYKSMDFNYSGEVDRNAFAAEIEKQICGENQA